jgi:hypothetical protein
MEAIFTTLVVMTIAVGGITTIADHQKVTSDDLTSSGTEVRQATAQLVSELTTVPDGELSTSASRD